MANTYKTAEIARIIGIHPNTVRLYEELELIPKPERGSNGYRIFTDYHVEQFKLERIALKVEVLQNGLRKKIIQIIKLSATKSFQEALNLAHDYLQQIQAEQKNAEEAIKIVTDLLKNKSNASNIAKNKLNFTRKEAADFLEVTIDTLRNWEMNGLLNVKRKENGYRIYADSDINQLKVIRSLRCANYSLASILRMKNALANNPDLDIRHSINTPQTDEDIVTACDRLITSLKSAEENAILIIQQLQYMQKWAPEKFNTNSTL